MTYTEMLTERRDAVEIITLNRPNKLNAWTRTLNRELQSAIERANENPEVGAIVLTGAGSGFCAGADIEESFHDPLQAGEKARLNGEVEPGSSPWVRLLRGSKPIVVALNGVAVGIGISMVLPADIILASDRARIGMFFVRLGVVPELASTHFLVQRVGFALASEMFLSGKLYDARELEGTGLFNRIVPHDELLDEAVACAAQIATNSAPALKKIKGLITQNGTCDDLDAVTLREHHALAASYETEEHKAAVAAFMARKN
ncbi:enoyl-CoA hydratase/isomerase family protein [Sneathiella glossodoripedis]|uniref:enoyl-CoA hydratase/isomerase family protein n=1 Tax=Sneathiella glossodoripedis TaxID=418853 RepID=UPI0004729E3A|nr:enoyl-CoA hydratase/isomerase family protein [Sneathiella glossodoripedis]